MTHIRFQLLLNNIFILIIIERLERYLRTNEDSAKQESSAPSNLFQRYDIVKSV